MRCIRLLSLFLVCVWSSGAAWAQYDITEFGAKGDGQTLCTEAIGKAMDACAADGGGTVRVPAGTFLSGTIVLKSGVTLCLESGAVLLGSKDLSDYPVKVPAYRSYTDSYTDKSLIYAERCDRIGIIGQGVIDGQGASFEGPYKVRPYMIRMIECRDVVVDGVTMRNSPMWVQHYLACEDVRLSGLTVKSLVNHNNDGIDIDSCRRVVVTGCNIDSGDDAIVLKSTSDRVCEDVVVSGCVLRSECNGLKMGTESHGGFRNIVLTGCAIWDTRLAGVALEIVDGGIMDRIVVSDITMRNVAAPIFVRLGNRGRIYKEGMAKPGVGSLRNVTISNIEGTATSDVGLAISGVPEAKIENLTLNHIRLSLPGGGSRDEAEGAVPENAEAYPEFKMFGKLPAYGFYCRHVKGLKLADVHLQLAGADRRHAVVFEDVENAVVDGLEVPYSNGAAPLLRFADVRRVTVRNSTASDGAEVFLALQGAGSERVTLMGNDFRGAARIAEVDEAVAETALTMVANVKD